MTLFSAPNYCGEFDNAGAMMSVDETLMCSFQVVITQVTVVDIACDTMMNFRNDSGSCGIRNWCIIGTRYGRCLNRWKKRKSRRK